MLFSIFTEKQHTKQTNSSFLKFSSSLDNIWSKLSLYEPLNMRLWTISNICTTNRAIFLSTNSWFHLHLLNFLFVYQFQSKMTIKIWYSIWTIPFTIKKVCYLKENMQLLPIPFTGTAKWYLKLIVWVANWATAKVVFASWARIELISSTCEWTRI